MSTAHPHWPSPYQFAIANTVAYLRGKENQAAVADGSALTAFAAAQVLSIAFAKGQADVLADLLK